MFKDSWWRIDSWKFNFNRFTNSIRYIWQPILVRPSSWSEQTRGGPSARLSLRIATQRKVCRRIGRGRVHEDRAEREWRRGDRKKSNQVEIIPVNPHQGTTAIHIGSNFGWYYESAGSWPSLLCLRRGRTRLPLRMACAWYFLLLPGYSRVW